MRSGGRTCRGDDEGCTLTNPEGRNTFQLNCLTVYSILSMNTNLFNGFPPYVSEGPFVNSVGVGELLK